jgi:hypothetical protein
VNISDLRDLLARAIGALENPSDLTDAEYVDVIDDLQTTLDELNV